MSQVVVMLGTAKGAFLCFSDEERREWRIEGPLLKGWEVTTLTLDTRRRPVLWAGVTSYVYGPHLQRSDDLGKSWTQIEKGPAYSEDSGVKLERVWNVTPGRESEPERLWCGVAEAGLFRSDDGGDSFEPVPGLNQHATRAAWSPGAGGLCCHTILLDPNSPERMWVGISAVGVFRSDDGGESFAVKNQGLVIVVPNEESPEVGSCVHKMVLAPESTDTLYQQNHRGLFRSRDAGDSWQMMNQGVPSTFGFPIVMHPRQSSTLWVVPQESDEYRLFLDGKATVYQTRDGGDSWRAQRTGLPENNFSGVLRGAMATDPLDPCGVYFGTTGGQVFYTRDEGESWDCLPCSLPRISSVSAAVLDD